MPKMFAQYLDSKVYLVLITPSKSCQIFFKFCQSGQISPNLVTLIGGKNVTKINRIIA